KELNIPINELSYKILEEKAGLFSRKLVVEVYEVSDAVAFAEAYLVKAISQFGIEVKTKTELNDDIINITLDTPRNPILIGKNGITLQALNELVRLATSSKFKKRFRILLDINDYKEAKYEKVVSIAKRLAKDVVRTKQDITLDPMPADERRMVHNALTGMPNIKTESVGEGAHRAICIRYIA
ncbi:MAG: KH domain-containing protein, partial [Firmicutes bacterium]|nr:KH domain-containing protein [Bacillota bacterium]